MKKWRFISNQNSTIVGINDAGIETFTANMHRSLVREIIQNSLDAVIPGSDDPVVVDFMSFDMQRDKLPDIEGLQNAVKKCRDSNSSERDAFNFFSCADKLLNQPLIKVLRISDHNTIGLEGSDTCKKGTSWSRLVKESGSSNKGQSSGGSFGIGKSAPFACSDIRTIFYSSMDRQGLKSNFGVARLVSFEDKSEGDWTTGVGYYSEDDKFVAIPELIDFGSGYERTDSGTDIYVIGMHLTDDFKNTFVKVVLLDFLVAFVKGKLVVNIQGEIIDKKSLPQYISSLNQYESDEIKDLLEYYNLLTSSNPQIKRIELKSSVYGEKYEFHDKACTLYLREGEGLNRKILITRNAGMRIFEQNGISGSIEFTGVLIIEGEKMNEAFKKMEVPSHDAWEPGRCRGEEKYYTEILVGLRRYLKNEVKECFGKITSNSMDAFGANDFLPDKREEKHEEKMRENGLNTQIKKLSEKSVEPTQTRTKALDAEEISSLVDESVEENQERNQSNKSESHSNKGKDIDSETGKSNTGEQGNYKEKKVKKRMICINANEGVYILSFVVPSTVGKGKLVFSLSGEQSDFDLPIKSAEVMTNESSASVKSARGNTVYLENLTSGEMMKVKIEIDFNFYCMMEVDYYENKK